MSAAAFYIRYAKEDDIDTLLGLIKELATFEKAEESAKATPELLKQTLFTTPYAHALLAISPSGQAVAYATYSFTFSTWAGKPVIHLGDLYVRGIPIKRTWEGFVWRACKDRAGKGLSLHRVSLRPGNPLTSVTAQNRARMDWIALQWNTVAIKFYQKGIGAQVLKDMICLKVDEEGTEKLAKSEPKQYGAFLVYICGCMKWCMELGGYFVRSRQWFLWHGSGPATERERVLQDITKRCIGPEVQKPRRPPKKYKTTPRYQSVLDVVLGYEFVVYLLL
ncbi:uncharacterized protein FOMMEDRAFT_160785 [Fomitiporia mediterranea MF3/22]|uniref:uncharacterized protein n=1 Tax=Fomitiporia mediterranea (strain MF3/22) TaxID=694068 RepID=UPI00044073C2|nr:uncharacterized protein FOMMEDRAFT_160785 [Fomitiporia mediterranea MF3/22]EJC99209.1 hypothetical protein FOMMEDRAFT_160785 [Fomitiporia mediterranea MF3/22]